MSKVTDRLDNKQIVELAKKQYEQEKQNSKFPANIITLPSHGKVYEETSALKSGKIEMRHMTAYDEDILSNSSYISEGVIFDKLLEALIVTPGVDISELVIGDKEWLLISARILGYGNEYPVSIIDSKTGKPVSAILDLSKLKSREFDKASDDAGCFEYIVPSNNDVIKYKYLSATDANKIDEQSINSTFLKMSIHAINGDTDVNTIEDYLKYELRAMDSRKLRKYIVESAPGINYETEAVDDKGATHSATFQFKLDLFWF
jgi:hypothetical protein